MVGRKKKTSIAPQSSFFSLSSLPPSLHISSRLFFPRFLLLSYISRVYESSRQLFSLSNVPSLLSREVCCFLVATTPPTFSSTILGRAVLDLDFLLQPQSWLTKDSRMSPRVSWTAKSPSYGWRIVMSESSGGLACARKRSQTLFDLRPHDTQPCDPHGRPALLLDNLC